jgi:mono/diheme cytochrome c family protein
MVHRSIATLAAVFAATLVVSSVAASTAAPQAKPPAAPAADKKQSGSGGWTLPADAETKKSPLAADPKVLAAGKTVFKSKCEKCHGPNGLGDGPDADPDHQEDMDLTKASRAAKNPDGVMFYKVSNGRKSPKMPAFKDSLNEEQIWSVIAYAKSLRK